MLQVESVVPETAGGMTACIDISLKALTPRTQAAFPSMSPSLADHASALLARMGALAWLYVLVPIPLITDWMETGALPVTPRG
jgi:hypothetical protein